MDYNNFDMNLLRTLDALFVEKSVTRAAERLCVSQPAMSGALQRLRDYFNDPLLIRMGRDMVLTPLAESLVTPVRGTLLQFQSALATRPSFDPGLSQRKFKFAMSDYGAFVLMPALLRRLALEAPHIACHVEPISGTTFARLESGDLDLLVTVESCEVAQRHREAALDLKTRRLSYDDFVCVIDLNHPTIGDSLTLEDYKTLPHVHMRFGMHLDSLVERAWKNANLDIHVAAIAPSFSSMLFMLPGTQMIATVQRRFAQALSGSLKLKVLECPVKVKMLQQVLVWHPRSDFDPGHQYARGLFVAAARIEADDESAYFAEELMPEPHAPPRAVERALAV